MCGGRREVGIQSMTGRGAAAGAGQQGERNRGGMLNEKGAGRVGCQANRPTEGERNGYWGAESMRGEYSSGAFGRAQRVAGGHMPEACLQRTTRTRVRGMGACLRRPRAAALTAGCQRRQSRGSPPPFRGGSGLPRSAAASARRPAQPWTSCLQEGRRGARPGR